MIVGALANHAENGPTKIWSGEVHERNQNFLGEEVHIYRFEIATATQRRLSNALLVLSILLTNLYLQPFLRVSPGYTLRLARTFRQSESSPPPLVRYQLRCLLQQHRCGPPKKNKS